MNERSKSSRETSRDYAHPHRPLPIRLVNALGRVRPFELDAVVEAAMRSTKLSRFHTEVFREPLRRLIASLNDEARLTPMGRFMTAQHFTAALTQNLRAGELFAARPQLLELELARPIMVCGLARSGTTLLQRLLAELPGVRSMAAWEAFEPIPERGWEAGWQPATRADDEPRIARLRTAERFLAWLSPDLFAVHPMDALAPEEDVLVLEHVFLSGVAESTYDVPSYAAWLEQQDQAPAYRWLADCMRALQWQRGGEAWLLKSPHHLEWLDTVFEVFPNMTIIQTHRDPVETVPSFCSLVAHGWGVFSNDVDPLRVGRHWQRKIHRMITRALATRDARDGAGFIDVDYRELVADPLAVMERLCTTLKLPWSEEIRARLDAWLAAHRQHAHGVHRYAAEDFGLSAGEIAELHADYRTRFGLG